MVSFLNVVVFGVVDCSPKRYRRDGKQERERDRNRVTSDGGDKRNPPLPHHSRREPFDASAPKKSNSNDHGQPSKHSSQPSRSRSYYQVILFFK